MGNLNHHKILFLFPYGYWHANPICVSLVERCMRDQIPFDVFCPSQNYCQGNGKEIQEWVWLVRQILPSALKQSFRRPWKVKSLWKSVLNFYRLKQRLKNKEYSLIITGDATGLALLNQLSFPAKTPLVYLSFHILFRREIKNSNEEVMAERELKTLRSISLALSQDENRKNLLSKELSLSPDLIDCIAVAPEQKKSKTTIPARKSDTKMILYCGNIEKWNIEKILDLVVTHLPPLFNLRIHTHFKPETKLLKYILALEKKYPLKFTFSFLDEPSLIELIDSAYIGLAPYFPQPDSWMVNQTLHHIGKASTKIAYYCMLKKPVITTPLPSLSRTLTQYPFGKAIENWSTMDQAILEIDSDYSSFSKSAYDYYLSELCPTEKLNGFWRKTKSLIPGLLRCTLFLFSSEIIVELCCP